MIVLSIHTAGPACELALVEDGTVLAECREPMMRGQDAELPGLTKDLLAEAYTPMAALSRLAVITGPGSFTGIRVGVAFARGLSLALKIPCLGVTSLEAALPDGQQGSALVALPAQKRPPDVTFWTQTFRTGMATDQAIELSADRVSALLAERPHMLFGDAEALQRHFPDMAHHDARPSAVRAAQVAMNLDPDLRPARPTYARAPDAALPTPKANP